MCIRDRCCSDHSTTLADARHLAPLHPSLLQVLRTVPGTVLWLLDGGETARVNLRRQARLAGVDEDRVVFAPLVGKEEHLQRLRLADLFVDTPVRYGRVRARGR